MKQLEFNFDKPIAFVIQYDAFENRYWDVYKNYRGIDVSSEITYKWCKENELYSNVERFVIFNVFDFPKELVDWSVRVNLPLLKYDSVNYSKWL